MEGASLSAPWQLLRLMDGYVTTQLVYVAAKLRIDEVLADGPRTGAEVAAAVGAQPGPLVRVLRGLVTDGVLAEEPDGRYSLTATGRSLSGLRGAAVVRGELYATVAPGLLEAVLHGGTAFEHVYGATFFEHLQGHPDHDRAFQGSMAGRAEQEATDVVAAYDFTGLRTLVDVGGGTGRLLAAILAVAPALRGILVDRASTIPEARAHLARADVGARAECVAGDFFDAVPEGGDAYLLSRILHDWDDDAAARILAVCRRAMAAGSRLLVVDAILPERAADRPGAIRMDLNMLLLLGARERTEAELRDLLQRNGFETRRVVMTASPAGLGLVEARAT